MKNLLILFVIVSFISLAWGQAVTDFAVPSNIPLGRTLTIDGKVTPANSDILCSFRVYDANTGALVHRLSDEWARADAGGVFASSYLVLNEPPFWRTSDFNVVADCNGLIKSAVFTVEQRTGLSNFFFGEVFYIQENAFITFWALIILFVLIVLGAAVWGAYKQYW